MSRLACLVALLLASPHAAQALTPATVICPAMFGSSKLGSPERLGGGLVASTEHGPVVGRTEGFYEIVTHCASGQSVVVSRSPSGPLNATEVVRAVTRNAVDSPEVVTLDELTARLSDAVGPADIRESSVEHSECLCQIFDPELVRASHP